MEHEDPLVGAGSDLLSKEVDREDEKIREIEPRVIGILQANGH